MNRKKGLRFAICLVIAVFLKQTIQAQNNVNLDDSPLDIAYFRSAQAKVPLVKVVYGRPSKVMDQVFGQQIPFDQLWSVGANEMTEVKFYTDVRFGETEVAAGSYILYAIPQEQTWQLILSSNLNVTQLSAYDAFFDVAKIKLPVRKSASQPYFTIGFKQEKNQVHMILNWDTVCINVPLEIQGSGV